MSDTTIDHGNQASIATVNSNNSRASVNVHFGSGPAARSGLPGQLEDPSLTIADPATPAKTQGQPDALFQRLDTVPAPDDAASRLAADPDFQDAFKSLIGGAAENSRTDMNALFGEFIAMLRDQRYSDMLQRLSNRQITIQAALVEIKSMQDAAASRKQGEIIGGATSIAAGAIQVVGGAVSLGLTLNSIKKLPALIKETKKMEVEIKDATARSADATRQMRESQAIIDAKINPRTNRPYSETELDAAEKAMAKAKLDQGDHERKLLDLNNTLNANREDLTKVESYLKLSGAITELTSGASQVIQGGGRIGTAGENYDASMSDVKAKQASIRHEISESDAQFHTDMGSRAADLLIAILTGDKDSQLQLNQTGINMSQKI